MGIYLVSQGLCRWHPSLTAQWTFNVYCCGEGKGWPLSPSHTLGMRALGWSEGPDTGHKDTQCHSSIPTWQQLNMDRSRIHTSILCGQGAFLCFPAPRSHLFSHFNLPLLSTCAQLQPLHLAALSITAHPIPPILAILPSPGTPNPLHQGFL